MQANVEPVAVSVAVYFDERRSFKVNVIDVDGFCSSNAALKLARDLVICRRLTPSAANCCRQTFLVDPREVGSREYAVYRRNVAEARAKNVRVLRGIPPIYRGVFANSREHFHPGR